MRLMASCVGLAATRCRRFMNIAVSLWAYFKCDCANHWLNVDCEERCGRHQVGPVWDKIGSPRPALTKGEPTWGERHPKGSPGLTRLRAASP